MIGPIRDYSQIYVALCGQDFLSWSAGTEHEKYCHICQAMMEKIEEEKVGDLLTADWHLDHESIIKHCDRPFQNTEEMAERFFEQTNKVLEKGDRLWILGDFAWRASNVGKWIMRFKRSVQINFVLGNHDAKSIKNHVSLCKDMAYTKLSGFLVGPHKCHLSHYPLFSWRAKEHGAYHFYGHSHGRSEETLNKICSKRLSMDIGIDCAYQILGEWRPFLFSEAIDHIKSRNFGKLET